jgi:hypothetical protein
MNIRCLLLTALLLTLQFSQAQTQRNKYAIGLSLGKTEYNGDYGSAILNFNQKFFNRTTAVSLIRYINLDFDLGIQAQNGDYGYYVNTEDWFTGKKTDASIFAHYKFNNDIFLDQRSNFSPFISVGVGAAIYGINSAIDKSETMPGLSPAIIKQGIDVIFPVGAGFKFQINTTFAIQYQYLYNFTFGKNADVRDTNRGKYNETTGKSFFSNNSLYPENNINDTWGEHLISAVFTFQKARYNYRGLVVRRHYRRRW